MAGGFAKRMYPLTTNIPKAMLEVDGKPVIEYIMKNIENIDYIETIYITTNLLFEDIFSEWISKRHNKKPVKLIVEPARTNEEKLGAIGALDNLLVTEQIKNDILVVASDNLFTFDLKKMLDKCIRSRSIWIGVYDIKNIEEAKRYGTVKIEGEKILSFAEKSSTPPSSLVSTGIYFFPKDSIKLIRDYILEKNNPDAFGYFFEWLHKRQNIYAHVFSSMEDKWFDIGSFEMYERAKSEFEKA